jgi:hypothetical protein
VETYLAVLATLGVLALWVCAIVLAEVATALRALVVVALDKPVVVVQPPAGMRPGAPVGRN